MTDMWIERRVQALFAEMFPPGSDGPPADFRIGDLYERATVEFYRTIESERTRDEYELAYRIVREMIKRGMFEHLGNVLSSYAIPEHVSGAAWRSFLDAQKGDTYAHGAWRAMYDPHWMPF